MGNRDRIDALEKRFNSLELRLDRERDRLIERTARRSTITPLQHHREVREAMHIALWVAAIDLLPIEQRTAWVEHMGQNLSWLHRDA